VTGVFNTSLAVGAAAAVFVSVGASGASTTDTAASLKTAIALEKQALKDLDTGDLGAVRQDLAKSRAALTAAKGGVSGPAAGDVRQAINKDEAAEGFIRTPVNRGLGRERINEAIVRKESALTYVDDHPISMAPPNKPPVITQFSASFAAPVTTYQVVATDPDDPVASLTFTWKKVQVKPCGVFTGNRQTATWSHPDASFNPPGDCPDEPVHPATITVSVTDPHGASCTATYTGGSAPFPPAKPDEECGNVGKPPLTPGEADQLSDQLTHALKLEQQAIGRALSPKPGRAASMLRSVARGLGRIEEELSKHAGTSEIEKDVHQAGELDGEGAVDVAAGDLDSAGSKLSDADNHKRAARKALDKIARGS
jgi:hypothetical protein